MIDTTYLIELKARLRLDISRYQAELDAEKNRFQYELSQREAGIRRLTNELDAISAALTALNQAGGSKT